MGVADIPGSLPIDSGFYQVNLNLIGCVRIKDLAKIPLNARLRALTFLGFEKSRHGPFPQRRFTILKT